MSPTWDVFNSGFAKVIEQLEAEKDAYLIEQFGSVEGVIACAPYFRLVEEPLDFVETTDGCIRVIQRIRIERIKPVPLVP